ncbi:unnamed protein product [Pieris macdunnoughi]|uniref:Uncharacterized protein n=1 Tax=Pieris macdunnoughi TaxID=345717 RepID=A0A821NMX3_9NEOP|nr:unnamed protein product [Pieris macdunnoughi]
MNQDNAPCHENEGKIPSIGLRRASAATVVPDFAPSDFFLFSDMKRMLAEFYADENCMNIISRLAYDLFSPPDKKD